MTYKTFLAAAVGVVLLGAAPGGALAKSPLEPGDAKPKRQCFLASRADGFAAPNDKILNVRVGVKDVYQFEMFGRCNDIDWAQRIALVSRSGSWICGHLDAEVIAPSSIGPQHCLVSHMRKLSPDEIKALPRRAKP